MAALERVVGDSRTPSCNGRRASNGCSLVSSTPTAIAVELNGLSGSRRSPWITVRVSSCSQFVAIRAQDPRGQPSQLNSCAARA